MSKSSDNSISFGVGLLFGVVAGAVAGILLSPKAGEEMRKDLKAATNLITDKNPKISCCKNNSIDVINKVKYTIEKQISNIQDAVKYAKMAAAKHREELESEYKF